MAKITILTDTLTAKTFLGVRKKEVSYADEVVVVKLPENLTPQQRYRQLKTSIRNRIDGDFLFIDCDTVIVKSLEEIDNMTATIAACRDTYSNFSDNPYRKMCLNHGYLLKWPIDDEKTLNAA